MFLFSIKNTVTFIYSCAIFFSDTTKRVTYLCHKIVVSTNSQYSTLNYRYGGASGNKQQQGHGNGGKHHYYRHDFLAPHGPKAWTIPPNRGYGMVVVRILRGALKLRYLLLGGAIGGGMTLNKVHCGWGN